MEALSGNLKMYIESGVQININNLTISGEKKRELQNKVGKNSTISHDAPVVIIDNAECSKKNLTNGYNLFEQVYSLNSKKITKFVAKNCILNTANAIHNTFNLYHFEEGATVEFDNCEFILNPNGNAVRFDNISGAKNILIEFNNCSWNYDPEASEESYVSCKEWLSLMGFQNATLTNRAVFGSELNWKVVINNCKYNNEDIEPNYNSYVEMTTEKQDGKHEEGKALLWMFDNGINSLITVEEHPEYFPQITIISGSNKKIYKM